MTSGNGVHRFTPVAVWSGLSKSSVRSALSERFGGSIGISAWNFTHSTTARVGSPIISETFVRTPVRESW
jgi:hypothetical protein